MEKAGPNEPKILSLVKSEKKCLMDIGQVIGDEKYECVRVNVEIRWLRSRVGSVYCVSLRRFVFGSLYL